MAINSEEYRSAVGLDSLYIAEVTQDDASGYTAGTPEYFAPAAEASAEPSVNAETQYADDMAYDALTAEGETTIKLKVTSVPSEVLAKVLGRVFDAASGRVFDNGGTPPYFALGFRSMKSNGSYRYFWFLKGRFSPPAEEFATKTDSPEPKTPEWTFTAVKTIHEFDLGSLDDGVKRVIGDEDTTNFSATGWFLQVQTPEAVTPSALALSSSTPADGASGVSRSANLTLTFNNALAAGAENHVMLLDAGSETVTCTVTISTDRKTITIDPSSTLAATAAHTLVYAGMTDVYGQTLSGTVEFTTGS